MAIGRVGSFATVEPALVDFGSMAERNIDKIKAEEEAKKAAKAAEAKAKGEALKDVKDIEAFKLSGVTGYDKTLSGTVNNMYQKFLDAKESYLNTGDRSYLLMADKIRNEVETINNESKAIGDTLTKFAELSKAEKINKDIADEKLAELQAIKDGRAEYSFEDGKTMMTFKDEEGNITNKVPASGYVTNMLSDIPEPFNLESTMNETVSKVKASTSEVGNALFQRKTTDINSPESAPQRKSLQNTAEYWSNNNGAMASWYQSKRAQEKANGNILPLKTSNWTEEERKEAQDYFYNQLKNKYAKEVTIDAQQPNRSGDGGGGGKKKFEPTIFSPYKKKDFNASGDGYAWSGDPKASPTLGTFSFVRTQGGKKTQVTANNAILKNLFMDKAGNVVILYDELAGTLSEREVQDEISALDSLLSQGSISESDYNEKVNTLKTQSTKPKYNSKLVIRPNDDDKLGMIANATGMYDSTSELLDDLRKKARMKNNTGSAKRSVAQIMKEDKVSFTEASKRFNNQ
jgi:hypothetical protein